MNATLPPLQWAAVLITAGIFANTAPGATFTILHTFAGFDGANPSAGLLLDAAGNLYGTTISGGTGFVGVVFSIDTAGNETTAYNFAGGIDGAAPDAGIIQDAGGNYYGTTVRGGVHQLGTVFKLDASGNLTTLHSFNGRSDGAYPQAGLVLDVTGNIYGTTYNGGSSTACPGGCGVIFKLYPSGSETLVYTFPGGARGSYPQAGLILDASNNLYGTTRAGGDGKACKGGCGTVFQVHPAGKQTVLHTFSEGDGAHPQAPLIRDGSGNLYGTTYQGGSSSACAGGCGVVFKLDSAGNESVLYSFSGSGGAAPQASLMQDAAGSLYGVTSQGGASTACGSKGCGVIFKLDTSGTETVLYSFLGGKNGTAPGGNLIQDAAGNFYGTTSHGGSARYCSGGCGLVFKLVP